MVVGFVSRHMWGVDAVGISEGGSADDGWGHCYGCSGMGRPKQIEGSFAISLK